MPLTLIFNLLLGGQGKKKHLPSGKGREICLSSNCLYFIQTCETFLRGCKSPLLHTLLKRSDLKNNNNKKKTSPPQGPARFSPSCFSSVSTSLLSCTAGQGETGPKDYRHFPATSKAKRREIKKKKVLFHVASIINRRESVREQRGASPERAG